jgi:ABC-type transport system involved in cytochrome c biogenesis permease subunit
MERLKAHLQRLLLVPMSIRSNYENLDEWVRELSLFQYLLFVFVLAWGFAIVLGILVQGESLTGAVVSSISIAILATMAAYFMRRRQSN